MPPWDTFSSRLIVTGRLEAVTAMRIGSGAVEPAIPAASDLPLLVSQDGRPFIPGSSLRGVVRSHIERVVRALEPDQIHGGRGACDPVSEKSWCITREEMTGWRGQLRPVGERGENPDEWLATQVWGGSCRVCRTFGNTWLASRVRFSDLPLVEDGGGHIELRDGVSIDRDKESVAEKYDFEVLPPGTAFTLSVIAENLDEAERGLMWLGLRELIDGHIRIGGFKGRGLGVVRLVNVDLRGVDAAERAALREFVLHGTLPSIAATPADVVIRADGWLEAFMADVEGE